MMILLEIKQCHFIKITIEEKQSMQIILNTGLIYECDISLSATQMRIEQLGLKRTNSIYLLDG